MSILLKLVALQVVIMTTCGVLPLDNKFGIMSDMAIHSFQLVK